MLYRLSFQTSKNQYLLVRSFAGDGSSLSAVQLNAEVFAVALLNANIPEPKRTEIMLAAQTAWRNPGMDVCCEQVKLTRKQLEILCLLPTLRSEAI
jgi:hypothetical protein